MEINWPYAESTTILAGAAPGLGTAPGLTDGGSTRLHSGTAAPGFGDGGDGTRGRQRHDSVATAWLGDGAASGSRGGGRRRGGGRASATAAGIGAHGAPRLDWTSWTGPTRFGARAGENKRKTEPHRRSQPSAGGDGPLHRRLVLPTGSDGRRPHHRWSQRPLRPPTLNPAVMRHHQRFETNRR